MKQTKQPLVSVIVLTRHTPLMILKRCISCIREQTYPNIELLLLDLNEKNNKYYAAIHDDMEFLSDVIYIEKTGTNEFANEKNLAIEKANGDYITFLSAQDYMPPKRVEKVMQFFLQQRDSFAVYTPVKLNQSGLLEADTVNNISGKYSVLSQIFFHRNCFLLMGLFDPYLLGRCDDEMWLRIHLCHMECYCKDEDTCITADPSFYNQRSSYHSAIGYQQMLVKNRALLRKQKNYTNMLYTQTAESCHTAGLLLHALQYYLKSFWHRRRYRAKHSKHHYHGKHSR